MRARVLAPIDTPKPAWRYLAEGNRLLVQLALQLARGWITQAYYDEATKVIRTRGDQIDQLVANALAEYDPSTPWRVRVVSTSARPSIEQ